MAKVRQVIDARPDLKNPKTAIAIILLVFSSGILFFAASKFNDQIEALLSGFGAPVWLAILAMVSIAATMSTLAYIIWRFKKKK